MGLGGGFPPEEEAPLRGTFLDKNLEEATPASVPKAETRLVYFVETTGPSSQPAKPVSQPAPDSGSHAAGGRSGFASSSESQAVAMQPYLMQLKAKLGQNIRYPLGRSEGEVCLNFVIDREGNLRDTKLVPQGSPIPGLQEEAIRGLRACSPFPSLPAWLPGSRASFTVRILFELEEG